MLLNEKSRPKAISPLMGALGGLWDNLVPAEIAAAALAGTGAGTPDANGTIVKGTVKAGQLICSDTSGNYVLMSSPDLSAAFPKLPWVVFSGDDNNHGATVGSVIAFHGGARLDTDKFDDGVYTPGVPLIASSVTPGNFAIKASATDHFQIVGFVGPRGVQDGVLDVYMPQGVCGY